MLQSELIKLRPLEEGDLPLLAQWRNEPNNFHWFASPQLLAQSEQAAWYEHYRNDRTQRQFMIDKPDGKTIGTLALMNIDYHHQSAEVGRVLVATAARGQGYGLHAMSLLAAYAFDELNLQRLWLVVFSDNTVALNFYAACGFEIEGVQRRAAWKAGAFHDLTMMALLREVK